MYSSILSAVAFGSFVTLTIASPFPTPFPAASPSDLQSRDHLVCDDNGWGCHIEVTCDNDFHYQPGVAISSSSSSSSSSKTSAPSLVPQATAQALAASGAVCNGSAAAPVAAIVGQGYQAVEYNINGTSVIINGTITGGTIVNNTLINGTFANGTSDGKTSYPSSSLLNGTIISINGTNTSMPLACKSAPINVRRRTLVPRQDTSLIQWCALGTAFYVQIYPQNKQNGGNIKTLINSAISVINGPTNLPNSPISTTTGKDTAAFATQDKQANRINVYQLTTMTWRQLGTALGLIQDWMNKSSYQWVSVTVYNGQEAIANIVIN